MAGWLSRTTSLFQQSQPVPEPFEVECDCGSKVVGIRAPAYQRPVCATCERPVFVLPTNVYPQPKPPTPSKTPPAKNGAKQQKPPKSGPMPIKTAVDLGHPPIPSRSTSGKPDRSKPVAHQPEPTLLREPRRPWVTPLRLISLTIMTISTVTAAGLWHRQSIETAKATVAAATDVGTAAMREGDFAKAAKELEKARLAVDLLKRNDETANEIRRLSREATALANLAASSLTELLDETLANAKEGQTDPLKMASLDQNAWVIFDTSLIPSAEGKDRFLVDAPIFLHRVSVQIEIESATIGRMVHTGEIDEAPRVIFAAQLDELSAPQGEPRKSRLKLNATTAFLWTSYETYCTVGYRPFDAESEKQTKATIERQREAR
jgi:hypothetical protein